ncbi:MAG: hypothetical protein JXR64_02390 [Spirochaetales bacterium]|nr:hypothetical protein [Spirochaetales bacterium]
MVNLFEYSLPYFFELRDSQKHELGGFGSIISCKSGDIVMLQGEFCQKWIIALEGNFLCKKQDDNSNKETILLEGESFDFDSIIKDSVTTTSLEAIGDSLILTFDLYSLKKISKKNPDLVANINFSFSQGLTELWNEHIINYSSKEKKTVIKLKESFINVLLYSLSIALIFIIIGLLVPFLSLTLLYIWIILFFLVYIHSQFSFIEVGNNIISMKEFNIKKFILSNKSFPLEKLDVTTFVYKNWFMKKLGLGSVTLKASTEILILHGVRNPERILSIINGIRDKRNTLYKAMEVASFKKTFCNKMNLLLLDNTFEEESIKQFTFKKSLIYFISKIFPVVIVFSFSSIIMFFLFKSYGIFLLDVIPLFYILWVFIDWRNDFYAFSGNKVIDIERKPFLGQEIRKEADLGTIQSIKKTQKHFFQILFNYGDIEITTLGENIIYPSIHKPDIVIDNLYLLKKANLIKEESIKKIERQEEFLDYTKYYQELTK